MRIEYVLIEDKNEPNKKADKKRIYSIIKKSFSMPNISTICVNGKRKTFELACSLTCQATDENEDNLYNLIVKSEHNDKRKQAELLEQFNTEFKKTIDSNNDYHMIIAYDEVSEYYCNKIYPKYQKFERQLRHLIYKVVAKAYGNFWTKHISNDVRKKLRSEIRAQQGQGKDDILIEQALNEMSLGQLIDFLFYSDEHINFEEFLDNYYPDKKLKDLSKEEILSIIEKARRKSIWNLYLANEISIEEPITKLTILKNNRNKVAHCKFFYYKEYCETLDYLDSFIPEIESAIEKNALIDDISMTDVLVGLWNFTKDISNKIAENVPPALMRLSEIISQITRAVTITKSNFKPINQIVDNLISPEIKQLKPIQIDYPKYNYPQIDLPELKSISTIPKTMIPEKNYNNQNNRVSIITENNKEK